MEEARDGGLGGGFAKVGVNVGRNLVADGGGSVVEVDIGAEGGAFEVEVGVYRRGGWVPDGGEVEGGSDGAVICARLRAPFMD